MKWTNEELVDIAEDTRISLETIKSDLYGIEEYKEIYEIIVEAISTLNEKSEPIEQLYNEECAKEMEFENIEYEKNVL